MAKQKVEIGQLSVDYQELQGQLKTAETLVKTLKSNLRDLSNVKIDKNGQVVGGFRALNTELDVTNKQMKAGKDLFRDFYKEQRIQDRTTREATQAVVGFTVGLATLINTGGESNKTVERLTHSLLAGVTAAQGAEFSFTAIGIAGRNLGGSLGKVATFLSQNAGWMGAIVGVGVGLVTLFRQSNEEAKKAAEEGLKKYNEMLDRIAERMQDFTPETAKARKDALTLELNQVEARQAIMKKLINAKKNGEKEITITEQEAAKAGVNANELLRFTAKQLDDEYKRLQDRARELATELNSIPTFVTGKKPTTTKEDARKQAEDEQKRKEEYEKRLMSLADQRRRAAIEGRAKEYDENEKLVDQELEKVKLQYQLHSISLDDAIAQLQALEAQTNEANKRLKIEAMIADLRERDAQLQMQRMNEQLDQASRIASLLQRAFSKSDDDFIAKLAQALQIAVNIAKIMNKKQGSDLNFGDYLEMGLNVASFFAGIPMFANGGELTRPQLRIAGEAGPEFYMPKRTFYDVARLEIIPKMLSMAKRDLVRSTTVINNNNTTTAVKLDTSDLRNEIAALGDRITLIAAAIENMPAPTVAVHNPVTLGEALKREMPVYEKFKSEKFIDQ
ncbi:MAG: hypothetical protein H3C35_03725 [Bacteroidetes bacterium]|nr:hypothetical protein [Bacteroidota bacterium]